MVKENSRETLFKRIPPEHIMPAILFLVIEAVLLPGALSEKEFVPLAAIAAMTVIAIIFIWRFFPSTPKEKEENQSIWHFDDLSKAIGYVVNDLDKIKKLDLFAHSSQAFFQHLRIKLINCDEMRVVLRNPDSDVFIKHKTNKEAVDSEKYQIKNVILTWSEMIKENRVNRGVIKLYDFEPTIYMCVINNDYLIFGFYNASQIEWGYSVKDVFVVKGEAITGKEMIKSYLVWFESVLAETSTEISL